MKLHTLKAPAGNKSRKRVGRGQGSGMGEQSGRGHNGLKSRSGGKVNRGFEGGQMPLQRRVPKFGFKNPFRVSYQSLNLDKLAQYVESGKLGTSVTLDDLVIAGLLNKNEKIKLLGQGDCPKGLEIQVHAASASALKKVDEAGGTVTIV